MATITTTHFSDSERTNETRVVTPASTQPKTLSSHYSYSIENTHNNNSIDRSQATPDPQQRCWSLPNYRKPC